MNENQEKESTDDVHLQNEDIESIVDEFDYFLNYEESMKLQQSETKKDNVDMAQKFFDFFEEEHIIVEEHEDLTDAGNEGYDDYYDDDMSFFIDLNDPNIENFVQFENDDHIVVKVLTEADQENVSDGKMIIFVAFGILCVGLVFFLVVCCVSVSRRSRSNNPTSTTSTTATQIDKSSEIV